MADSPNSPRLLKGALVGADPAKPLSSLIVFQYNPDTLARRVEARTSSGGDGDRLEALRLSGPPKETITLSVEMDAADQPQQVSAVGPGIHGALAALEMLLYPRSALVFANLAKAQAGMLEVIPPEAPLTLFVWGANRVVPVRLSDFTITEEAYDPLLNPIRAKVDLALQVLSYYDLKVTNPGFALYMAYQLKKELMAAAQGIQKIGGALPV